MNIYFFTMYQNLSKYRYNLDRGRSKSFILLYELLDTLLIKWTPKPFNGWRNMLYRVFGAKIGKNVRIDPHAKLLYPWNIEIGNNVWIGYGCDLYSVNKIILGNDVALAHNIFLATAAHDITKEEFPTISAPIIIEDEVWISSGVFIQQGVTIHKGAVIAACSLVTKDIPEGMVAMGHPAKPIKNRKQ